MTAPASDGKDSASGRFRLTIPQMLWLVALCGLACGFAVRATRSSQRQGPYALAFSPDSNLLAANFERGGILIWDVSGTSWRRVGSPIRAEDRPFLSANMEALPVRFVGPSTIAYSPRWDGIAKAPRVILWDVRKSRALSSIQLKFFPLSGAAMSPDGSLVACDNYAGAIDVLDSRTGKTIRSIATKQMVGYVAFSNDGQRLLAVSDSQLETYQVDDGRLISTAKIVPRPVAAFSPDGRRILMYDSGANGILHSIGADGEWEFSVDAAPYAGVCFTADSRQFVVDTGDGVQVWDVAKRQPVRMIELVDADIRDLAVAPHGRMLAIAETDRISLWDLRSGKFLGDVWTRNPFFEALLFSAGFFGWAVVWGLMRRRPPRTKLPPVAESEFLAALGPKKKPASFRALLLRLVLLLVLVSTLMALPVAGLLAVLLGGEQASIPLVIALTAVASPIAVVLLTLLGTWILKQVLGYDGAELQRARDAAQRPGRTASFGRLKAYFFGTPLLESHFAEDLTTVHARLARLLGETPEAPRTPVFCFQTQQEFDAYAGRKLPVSGIYSPPWWNRQVALCERSGYGPVNPREIVRTLLSYMLLWRHKRFRLPSWLTVVANQYATYADDLVQAARVHRRLAVELERTGTLAPMPHTVSDKEYVALAMARDQREPFHKLQVYTDVCSSLGIYLTGDEERLQRFCAFLRGLRRGANVDAALRRDYGCGVEELIEQWRGWLAQRIAETQAEGLWEQADATAEFVRAQILEEWIPFVMNAEADLERRGCIVRSLGTAGSLLSAEPLIELLSDASPEIRQDALWSLEALAGRRVGESPEAWRGWLQTAEAQTSRPPAPAASHHVAEERIPVEAGEADGGSSDSSSIEHGEQSAEGEIASGVEAPAVSAAQPILAPPRTLTMCWTLMVLGGAAAIFLSVTLLFATDVMAWPMWYYSLAIGVLAVTRGVGRHTRWLRLVGGLQVSSALGCDVINVVLGIIVLTLSRTRSAREYLAAQLLSTSTLDNHHSTIINQEATSTLE
jgi:hypothetical protein